MAASNPFSHASHNYSVCYKLKELGDCNDWVVTTAFYAALKFMNTKLFPGDYKHPTKYTEETFKKTLNLVVGSF